MAILIPRACGERKAAARTTTGVIIRKILPLQIAVFMALLAPAVAGAAAIAYGVGTIAAWGSFRGIVQLAVGIVGLYACALLVFRAFLRLFPLLPGEIPPGSRQEFIYHVYQLFLLMLFYPVMRSGAVPVPLMRMVYLALGARLGANTYSSGIIFDPGFVSIGENSIVGQYALLVPHVNEGRHLAHFPIEIGSNVTIGAHAVVMCDVVIGDNAIVAVGAIVPKGTRIAAGEVWAGVPARRMTGTAGHQPRAAGLGEAKVLPGESR